MKDTQSEYVSMTRRELLKRSLFIGSSFVIGSSFISAMNAAWALEVKVIKPETMATLVQMARDIYPHDTIADEYYVNAVKSYDNEKSKKLIEEGIDSLNKETKGSYLDLGWESQRVKVLHQIEDSPFFQTVRGGLVTGLYNQKDIWPIFGYEGESYSKGGYIKRGFNDINWL